MLQDQKCSETRKYHASFFIFQCIYGPSNEGGQNIDKEDGRDISREGENTEITWPVSCMQMTWFYVASQKIT